MNPSELSSSALRAPMRRRPEQAAPLSGVWEPPGPCLPLPSSDRFAAARARRTACPVVKNHVTFVKVNRTSNVVSLTCRHVTACDEHMSSCACRGVFSIISSDSVYIDQGSSYLQPYAISRTHPTNTITKRHPTRSNVGRGNRPTDRARTTGSDVPNAGRSASGLHKDFARRRMHVEPEQGHRSRRHPLPTRVPIAGAAAPGVECLLEHLGGPAPLLQCVIGPALVSRAGRRSHAPPNAMSVLGRG